MGNDIKINQANFNLSRGTRTAGTPAASGGVVRKSSYIIPEETHLALKRLALDRRVKLNELIMEAFEDLLAKYGK